MSENIWRWRNDEYLNQRVKNQKGDGKKNQLNDLKTLRFSTLKK